MKQSSTTERDCSRRQRHGDPTTRLSGTAARSSEVLAPGSEIEGYVLGDMIAAGGFGTVYRARHRVLGRDVAIKVLHSALTLSGEAVERFLREARAVNRIRHPHIVDIYEFGRLRDGRPYHIMELLDGDGLDAYVDRHGPLPPSVVLELAEPLGAALVAAHAHGIFHRDIKPSNVVVMSTSGGLTLKLVDFGIAKLAEAGDGRITGAGTRMGTPFAMAPEQFRGDEVDGRTDIYSLGVVLFFALTGTLPFLDADLEDLEMAHMKRDAPRPSAFAPVPSAVDEVILTCLAKRQEDRYQDVSELLIALRNAVYPRSGHFRMHSSPAVGIRVLAAPEGHSSGPSSGTAVDAEWVLDMAESVLSEAGFVLAVQTEDSVLAVSPIRGDAKMGELQRRDAIDLATELAQRLASRPQPHPELRVRVGMTCGHVVERVVSGRRDVVGGHILDPANWTQGPLVPGVGLPPGAG